MADATQLTILDQFWQTMNLPDSCLLNSRIYKKTLLESIDLSSADKKLVNEDIDTLVWRYTLKPETIQIQRFQSEELDYPEIAVIHLTLKAEAGKNLKRLKRLIELIQRAIPYPVVLVTSLGNQLWVNLANKRQSMADRQKLTVESFFDSGWLNGDHLQPVEQAFIESLPSQQLDWTNFFTFYQGLVDRLIALEAARHTGQFHLEDAPDRESNDHKAPRQARKTLLENIRQLEEEQNSLKAELKKETQFNRRLELNMNIKRCQQAIQKLTSNL